MEMAFCAVPQDGLPVHIEKDCTLSQKPARKEAWQIWLHINNLSDQAQNRLLVVLPYYHPTVEIYRLEQGAWVLQQTGGSRLGGRAASASLGGHRFAMTFSSGETELLVRIPRDPSAAELGHFRALLEDGDRVFSSEQVMIALHLGMLLMLFLLTCLGWVVEHSVLQFRLMLMTAVTLLSVLIGSGAFFLVYPSASTHWWGMVVFASTIVLRTACILWIYEAMTEAFQPNRRFHTLSRWLYAMVLLTVFFFAVEQPTLGWLLTLLILPAVYALSAFGLYAAVDMPPRLMRILQISLAVLLLFHVLGIAGMTLTQGQDNFPIYISRLIDLSLPISILITILLRNKILKQEYGKAKEVLDAQTIALESERRSRDEKRMLLDMLTHEIKNPLASINFAVTNLSQSPEGDFGQTPRRLENISRSVMTIDQIIEHCNLANGIEDDRIAPRLENIDIVRMLQDLIDSSQQPDRLLLTKTTLTPVKSDLYLLRMIAANLIDNALKYALTDTPIYIEPFQEDKAHKKTWGFRIINAVASDRTPDPLKIFERYYRHPLALELRGSGLGLSICRQICRLLGGHIEYHCAQSRIVFEVYFESK